MIKINSIVWGIRLVSPQSPHLYRPDGSLTIGMCDSSTKIIYINAFLEEQKMWNVLVHELAHASLFSYGLNLDFHCHEELIADFIATHGEEIINNAKYIYKILKERLY